MEGHGLHPWLGNKDLPCCRAWPKIKIKSRGKKEKLNISPDTFILYLKNMKGFMLV